MLFHHPRCYVEQVRMSPESLWMTGRFRVCKLWKFWDKYCTHKKAAQARCQAAAQSAEPCGQRGRLDRHLCRFAQNGHSDLNHNVGVQGHGHGAVADQFDRAIGHANLRLDDFITALDKLFGNVEVGD